MSYLSVPLSPLFLVHILIHMHCILYMAWNVSINQKSHLKHAGICLFSTIRSIFVSFPGVNWLVFRKTTKLLDDLWKRNTSIWTILFSGCCYTKYLLFSAFSLFSGHVGELLQQIWVSLLRKLNEYPPGVTRHGCSATLVPVSACELWKKPHSYRWGKKKKKRSL